MVATHPVSRDLSRRGTLVDPVTADRRNWSPEGGDAVLQAGARRSAGAERAEERWPGLVGTEGGRVAEQFTAKAVGTIDEPESLRQGRHRPRPASLATPVTSQDTPADDAPRERPRQPDTGRINGGGMAAVTDGQARRPWGAGPPRAASSTAGSACSAVRSPVGPFAVVCWPP